MAHKNTFIINEIVLGVTENFPPFDQNNRILLRLNRVK